MSTPRPWEWQGSSTSLLNCVQQFCLAHLRNVFTTLPQGLADLRAKMKNRINFAWLVCQAKLLQRVRQTNCVSTWQCEQFGVANLWSVDIHLQECYVNRTFDYQTWISLSLCQFWDRSGVVSQWTRSDVHTRLVCYPNIRVTSPHSLLGGNSVPGPSVCSGLVSFLSLLLGSVG